MALYGTSDALICRAFPTTFRGSTRAWLSRLHPFSVSSFDQLTREFEQNFLASAFLMGLRPLRFFWSLIEKPPATIPEMLQRANQYITAEALMAGRHEDNKRPRMDQSRGAASVPPSFNWDYSHDTKDCRDLQNQIEELIQRGHLRRYLKELGEVTMCPRGPVKMQIDVITGGPEAGDSSSMARKAYARSTVEKHPRPELKPEITFGTEEVERSHHDDALVISIRITNARVKRVMVDTRSSTDVLYLDAFKKLGLTNENLTLMNSVRIESTKRQGGGELVQ
ncbi:uncharacterized protein LOC135650558 [Musa acuminata AAA Group]|uniref:uncharacterized protein LOC135650558 n=1 Tax=Musa acuminata AAA Group TaxID=214697 RepID=UPI0031D50B5F